MPARQEVRFVTHADAAMRGSTEMRSRQLVRMVEPYLGDRYDLQVVEMPARSIGGRQRAWIETLPKGGIYILTKVAVERLPRSNALALQEKADGVCFDYVDTKMSRVNMVGADIHICTSVAQLNAVRALLRSNARIGGKAMPLHHNADLRLYELKFTPGDRMRAVYWAAERNGFLPRDIRSRLDIIDVDTISDAEQSIPRLPRYNLHYAVRNETSRERDVYKPFTRGFVAAICRSNIVALHNTPDVTEFLGDDYPYLATSRDIGEISDILDRAARDFGGPAWDAAMQRMEAVADRVSPSALASQLGAIIKELGH